MYCRYLGLGQNWKVLCGCVQQLVPQSSPNHSLQITGNRIHYQRVVRENYGKSNKTLEDWDEMSLNGSSEFELQYSSLECRRPGYKSTWQVT